MAIESKQEAKTFRHNAIRYLKYAGHLLATAKRNAESLLQHGGPYYRPITDGVDSALSNLSNTAVGRFVTSNLLRRIVVSNLLGLAVLFVGVLYPSQFNVWLIDAKRETLQSQGRIIAGAIASSLSPQDDRGSVQFGSTPNDENPFADIMFSLGPERVTPVLRRLLAGTDNRARVYDKSGNLVADSIRLLPPGGLLSTNERGEIVNRPGCL